MLRCMAHQQVAVSNIDQEAGVAAPACVFTYSVGMHCAVCSLTGIACCALLLPMMWTMHLVHCHAVGPLYRPSYMQIGKLRMP